MPFVKLDTGILDSTLWVERECREVFLTALLMAEPIELLQPMPQFEVKSMELTGFVVPIGWYGMVRAAGLGIVRRAMVDPDVGLIALERLGMPELQSRSPDFEGRRLVRIDGGFIVLNYMKYRDRDYTGAERAKRYRERQKQLDSDKASRRNVTPSHRDITQAEAEVEAELKTKPKARADAPFVLPDWVPKTQWDAWIEARKKKRNAPTDFAMRLAVSKLEHLREQGENPAAVLAQSAFHGWAGVFPVKK